MIIIIIFANAIKLEFESLATNYTFVKNRENLLLDSITEGVCWLDKKGDIVFANRSAKFILGYSEDDKLLGENFHKLVHKDEREPKEKCAVEITLKNGTCNFFRNEYFVRKDGKRIPVAVFTSPIIEKDKITGAVVTFIDLTHEVKQREEIEKYKTIIEQASVIIVITDKDGNIQYVNPTFEKITGYSKSEVLGKNPRILKSGVHPKSFYENLWNTILSGKMWEGEFVNKKKDGAFYYEEANIFPIRNREGKITNFVGIKKDITKSKMLEEQLFQAQKMEAIGRLTGSIAHDFNNILTIISGYAEMLQKNLPSKHTEKILEAVERAKDLINKLLAFSRKQEINPKPINIVNEIKSLEKMIRRLIPEDIELKFNYSEENLVVFMDPTQIEQILINLIVNSRDALYEKKDEENKKIEVNVKKVENKVLIEVKDNGIGIPKSIQNRIFEPFFTTKKPGIGTGLGLSTVYGIVLQNKGEIKFKSEVGKGTSFFIYLPLFSKDKINDEKQNKEVLENLPKGKEKVLVVEDEKEIKEILNEMLTSLGYKVSLASNGQEALETLEKNNYDFDLIISDIIMPEMDGYELYSKIQSLKPSVKFIFTTGYSDEALKELGVKLKKINFLKKPFTLKELSLKIREVLNSQ